MRVRMLECSQCTAEISVHIVHNVCSSPSIRLSSYPQAYNGAPFKWLKLLNTSTNSSAGHGCTQRAYRKHYTPLKVPQLRLQSHNGRRTDKSPKRHLITDDRESLTLQAISTHILYYGANKHSP